MEYDEEWAYWQAKYKEDFGPLNELILSATRSYCEMATGQKALGSILHIYGYESRNNDRPTSAVFPVITKKGSDTAARAKALEKLGRKACRKGISPAYAILMAEAWMAVMTEEEMALAKRTGYYPRPSEQADRKEVINTVARSLTGESHSIMVDIIRNGKEILPGAETILPRPMQDNLLPAFFMGYGLECFKEEG